MPILNIVHYLERKILELSRIVGISAIVILVLMMLFTVTDVVLRAFFNHPIPGDVELIEMAMVCVGFLGLAWCAMRGMHIKVDMIVSLLPKRVQGIIDSFCYLSSLIICSLIVRQTFIESGANRELNKLSGALGIPIYPFYLVVALGYTFLCLAILVLLFRAVAEAIKG